MNRSGEYIRNMTGEAEYRSFRPAPLPPEPPLEMDEDLLRLLVEANRRLAQLDISAANPKHGGVCVHVCPQGGTDVLPD